MATTESARRNINVAIPRVEMRTETCALVQVAEY